MSRQELVEAIRDESIRQQFYIPTREVDAVVDYMQETGEDSIALAVSQYISVNYIEPFKGAGHG